MMEGGMFDNLTEESVCVLLSGGLDSCVLAATAAKKAVRVFPVYVRAGLFWEATELQHVQRFLTALNLLAVAPLQELSLPAEDLYGAHHWSISGQQIPDIHSDDREVYLPGRNLLLLSKAALFCALRRIPVLALGLLKGNPFPDSTPDFLNSFAAVASRAMNFDLTILTPFLNLTKIEVIRAGRDLPLELTFSCLNPVTGIHCGVCNKCAERRLAFSRAGIPDKTRYQALPEL
jgi:7-cyano-7-deazaguanine synthase